MSDEQKETSLFSDINYSEEPKNSDIKDGNPEENNKENGNGEDNQYFEEIKDQLNVNDKEHIHAPAENGGKKIIIFIIVILLITIAVVYLLFKSKKEEIEETEEVKEKTEDLLISGKDKTEDLLISGKEKAEETTQNAGIIKEEKSWKKPTAVFSGVITTIIVITLSLYFYFRNQ